MNGLPDHQLSPSAPNAKAPIGKRQDVNEVTTSRTVHLYGLFDADGKCRYVGATYDVYGRKLVHRRKYKELQFRVLRRCSIDTAQAAELKLLKKYQSKGQADLNKKETGWNSSHRNGVQIYCPETGKFFRSIADAGYYFNVTHQTIKNRVARKQLHRM